MGDQRHIIVGCLFVVLGLTDLAFEPVYRLIYGRASYSNEATFQIPASTLEIALDRRCAHVFLAEYERTIVLRDDDGDILRFTAAFDTGGHSRMRLYRLSESEFYLQGDLNFDQYALNVLKPSIERRVMKVWPPDSLLIGSFDRDEKGWRFIPARTSEL